MTPATGTSIASPIKMTKIHVGGAFDDTLVGDAVANNIFVDFGSSDLFGYNTIKSLGSGNNLGLLFGNNNVYLGDGNNTLIFLGGGNNFAELGTGSNRVQGGDGSDIITVGVHKVEYSYILEHEDGTLTREFAQYNDPMSGGKSNGVNYVDGGAGNDSLMGNAGRDTLLGGIGDDYLGGGYNDDTLSGGDGNDFIDGGPGHDIVDAGRGSDTIYVSNDMVNLGNDGEVDYLYVNAGMSGPLGVSVIEGVQANDVLRLYWWQNAQVQDDLIVVTDLFSGAMEYLVGNDIENMQVEVIGKPIYDFDYLMG